MWVLYSERPLRAAELCHALGVEIGSANLDPENVPGLRTLVSSCLGLVTVEESSSTVRLVHFTLKEYLASDPTLFHSPHSTIAGVCLTYLNFASIRDLAPNLDSAPATTPLLEYASIHWGLHTEMGMTENIKILALRLLDTFDEHISAQLPLLHHRWDGSQGPHFDGVGGPTGFTGLHGAAFLGVMGVVPSVLVMKKWDVNSGDCMGMTALTRAAGRGHEEVVKMLLEREDVNPDQSDTFYGRTPLSWAAENGHERIAKMLLEREDVNPYQADLKYGRTPLLWAAKKGHEGIVKMLLEREDVNPNQPNTKYGQTPRLWAAENGHDGIVKILLEREGVNPDQADTEHGQISLSWVADSAHDETVNLLMERNDIRTAMPYHMNQTPQPVALPEVHYSVARIPPERDTVNCAQADYGSQISLSPSAMPQNEDTTQFS